MSMTTGGGPDAMSTLTRPQRKLQAVLGPMLKAGLARGAGELGEDLFSPEELQAIEDVKATYGDYTGARERVGVEGALADILSGRPSTTIDERATEEYFEKSIATPLSKRFVAEVLPKISRAYKGFTSRRGQAVERAYSDFADVLSGRYSELRYADEQARRALAESAAVRQAGMLPQAQGILTAPMQTALGFGSVMSTVQAKRLQEAQRMLPESNPWIAQAMQFLGIPMTQIVDRPADLTGFGDVMAAFGAGSSGAAAAGGAYSSFTGGGAAAGAGAAGAAGASGAAAGGGAASGAAILAMSDVHLKTSLRRLFKIAQGLTVHSWKWNKKANELGLFGRSMGLIAQEVERVIPSAVVVGSDSYKRIDYFEVFKTLAFVDLKEIIKWQQYDLQLRS